MLYNTSHLPSLMRYGLSFQHFIAVFFATILTSLLLGLPVPVAMFFSGLSTLFYHYFTNGKIPQYISTSMQGITGMLFVKQMCMAKGMPEDLALCYTLLGGFVIGVIYIIFSGMLRFISTKTISKILPPALVGSLIMVIGIQLFVSALYTIKGGILIGMVTIATILAIELLLKGRYRVMSINAGLLAGILVTLFNENIDLSLVANAKWLDFPFNKQFMAFRVLEWWDLEMISIVILTVIPIAFTTLGEHVADLITISKTTKKDYLKIIGLHNTIGANGMTSILASVFGAPQNTTYTETTGLIQLNRICDPHLIRITAMLMIALSFCPKMAALIGSIPVAVIGAITLVIYCMIVMVGWKTVSEIRKKEKKRESYIIITTVIGVFAVISIFFGGSITVLHTTLSASFISFLAGILVNINILVRHGENK